MKLYGQQFRECSEAGLTKGRIKTKITPDLLPFCPAKAKKMARVIKKNKITHFHFIKCGRFGGQCKSSNPQCKELRMAGKQTEVV